MGRAVPPGAVGQATTWSIADPLPTAAWRGRSLSMDSEPFDPNNPNRDGQGTAYVVLLDVCKDMLVAPLAPCLFYDLSDPPDSFHVFDQGGMADCGPYEEALGAGEPAAPGAPSRLGGIARLAAILPVWAALRGRRSAPLRAAPKTGDTGHSEWIR